MSKARIGLAFATWAAAAAIAPAEAGPRTTPEAAMRSFLVSIWTLDREAFLSHFSKSRPHYVSSYLDGVNRKPVAYSELAKEINARDGHYCDYMIDCEALDVFADQVVSDRDDMPPRLAMWVAEGADRFRPKGGGKPVRWRKEAGVWVVDEIGEWVEPREEAK